MQVYYPTAILNKKEGGWLVGWQRGSVICIAFCSSPPTSLSQASDLLQNLLKSNHNDKATNTQICLNDEEFWGAQLKVIGRLAPSGSPSPAKPKHQAQYVYEASCHNYAKLDIFSAQLATFALTPHGRHLSFVGFEPCPDDVTTAGINVTEHTVTNYIAFDKPVKCQSVFTSGFPSANENPPKDFEFTLRQINSIWQIEQAMSFIAQNNSNSLSWLAYPTSTQSWVARAFASIFIAFIRLILFLSAPIRWIIDTRIPQFGSLKDISMSAKQIDARLQLLHSLLRHWSEFTRPQGTMQSTTEIPSTSNINSTRVVRNDAKLHREWAKFYNGLSVVLVDWLLGFVFIYLWLAFVEPTSLIQHTVNTLSPSSIPLFSLGDWRVALPLTPQESLTTTMWGYNRIKWMLEWISAGKPGGIKLNLPAATAIGNLFLFYIERWAGSFSFPPPLLSALFNVLVTVLIRWGSEYFPTVVYLLPLSGILGAAFFFSSIHDIMFFVNMHVYWLYTGVSRLYYIQMRAIRSCWLLFRGTSTFAPPNTKAEILTTVFDEKVKNATCLEIE